MSKYIIDIPKTVGMLRTAGSVHYTYFDGIQVQTIVLKGDEIDEELNADYVNEHFGILQDDAYNAGFEEGKKEAESSEAIEQAKADAFNKGMLFKEEKIHDAYQRGLDDAWEAARKLYLNGACKDLFGEYFNTFIKNHTAQEAINKIKAYEEKQKADDKIEVGDIVERYLNGKLDSTGIYLREDGDYWNCLFWTGAVFSTFAYPKNQFKKTEKHVDIASILDAMKHD